MTATDAWRWIIIVAALLDLGATLALLERVGRYFRPRLWIRVLFAANVGWVAATAWIVYKKLGAPVSGSHIMLGLSALLEFAALVGLWGWFGTAAGREHTKRMLE